MNCWGGPVEFSQNIGLEPAPQPTVRVRTKSRIVVICDEGVRDATEWQKNVQEGMKSGLFSRMDELRAEADLLEAQITRENAEHDEE
jgi:hypothetical protein